MYKKMLLERDIRKAMSQTKSNAAAARYLQVSRTTYKYYATIYRTEDNTMSLYEAHKNPASKGIVKVYKNYIGVTYELDDLLKGKYPEYPLQRLRARLVKAGLLIEECEMCGFNERRITDLTVPLLLAFRNNDSTDWRLENIACYCYNCYYLSCGNIISSRRSYGVY